LVDLFVPETEAEKMTATKSSYPPIGALGAVGDGHSLALLGPDAAVEWFCPARFDTPPLIWPLLDRRRGGRLRIAPAMSGQCSVRYIEDTAVLEYDWRTEQGQVRLQVAMDWPVEDAQQRLLWQLECLSGRVDVEVEFAPSPDFGRIPAEVSVVERTAQIKAGELHLSFSSSCFLQPTSQGLLGKFTLEAGQTAGFCLSTSTSPGQPAEPVQATAVPARLERAIAAWREWSANIIWQGAYRDSVLRSAITLKLLIYEPTGAVVAAGTTSLPEDLGGVRNWDYRYTWFRDASLTLNALFGLGCRREAHRWAQWMQEAITGHGLPLRVIYRVDGGLIAPEQEIPGVEGYRGSLPVRVGNAAESQLQLDLYGEILDCVFICETMNDAAMRAHWPHLRKVADFIATHWREADSGIWEVRDYPRHFVHSKVMAWIGLQRAIWFRERHAFEGDGEWWKREAQALREEVLRCGIAEDGRHFTRAYGEPALDASLLRLPLGGFIHADSPLFAGTLAAISAELSPRKGLEGLLLRYRQHAGDGLPGAEGAFTLCSFWLVEALAAAGRQDEAQVLFERLLTLQGDLGLYAEEIDPANNQHLGNFPQAFTHIGLINTALRLRACGLRRRC
jgi:GH15 family glucan-1,4-alpha-glucosidase